MRWAPCLVATLWLAGSGCTTSASFDGLIGFGPVQSRHWFTATYFLNGVQHDSHVLVLSERRNYCAQVEAFRLARADVADPVWSWVGANVGWDVERGDALLGEGDVAVPDPEARRADWRRRAEEYLEEAGSLWDEHFVEAADVLFVQFHRGERYAAGDRAEHDSPLRPAADGEGEILVGDYPLEGAPGDWQWDAAVGLGAGNPYSAAADSLGPEFAGLARVWDPTRTGEWFRASGGVAEMRRSSVHSWDMDIRDGLIVDGSGEAAGGFQVWGNYYRCFLDYGELEDDPAALDP